MVTEVRFLEDELMAEQFKGETLRRENQQNQELIETLEQTLDRQGE